MLSAALLLGVAAPRAASSQTVCNGPGSCPVTATSTVNSVARLTVTSTTTTLTAPKAVNFGAAAGVTTTGPTVTVMSNTGYTLTASAGTATWSGPPGTTKPASDLKMKVDAGSIVPLGRVGSATAGTASAPYAITYNTVYGFTTDKPGTYTLVVNYTLTAP